jgi:hypothetical protein
MIGFPQLSLPLTVPQFLPTRSQNAAFPSLTHASPSETPTSDVAASSRSPRASLITSFEVARSLAPDSASPDPAAPSFASPPACPLASTLPAPPPLLIAPLVPALPPSPPVAPLPADPPPPPCDPSTNDGSYTEQPNATAAPDADTIQ